MAIIKSYSDLEQSRKLAEILPIESADMHYNNGSCRGVDYTEHFSAELMSYQEALHLMKIHKTNFMFQVIPCWSLSALLKLIPDSIYENTDDFAQLEITKRSVGYHDINDNIVIGTLAGNLVDACYKMILKLNELNLL